MSDYTAHQLRLGLPRNIGRWDQELIAGQQASGVDALTLAAIMSRESGGGLYLEPSGAAGTGDSGNGLGLMQIDKRYHPEFASVKDSAGRFAWQDAERNVVYAALFLKGLLQHFKSDKAIPVEAQERCAIAAYNCGLLNVQRGLSAAPKGSMLTQLFEFIDSHTTKKDYSRDVVRRRAEYIKLTAPWSEPP